MQVIQSGLNARGIERHSKEHDAYIHLTYGMFREQNEYKYIVKNKLVSFEQLDEWSNDRDMETEGMDDAKEWAEYQEMNY
jgi:hypothetical protein